MAGEVRRGASGTRLAAIMVLLAAACGGAGPTDASTGLQVTVYRGPLAPVVRLGEPNIEPVAGARVEVGAGATTIAFLTTDTAGVARAPLPAGDYSVRVTECPGSVALPPPDRLSVVEGSFAATILECDTGIR